MFQIWQATPSFIFGIVHFSRIWIDDYFIQCTAYASMYEEHTGISIDDIIIMMVAEDGQVQIFEKKTADYLPKLETLMDDYCLKNWKLVWKG